ncbi:MAG: citramalate synthase [Mycobacteriales bacterium]
MAANEFHVYDTTLRDGAQREGLSLSVHDKLGISRYLDELGVGFIEGGWPGSNPKDAEFFERAKRELSLSTATLTAFGATRRPGVAVAADSQVRALLEAETAVVTLVAKAHDRHVEQALRTTLGENLAMVEQTVRYLCGHGRRVFLDAEHFFDGYQANPGYALDVLKAAADGGAEVVVLCDTNGGTLPNRLGEVVHAVAGLGLRVGIHAHNDSACAVANTLAAVDAGASHVQGTANGYGERCGNADIFAVVAALELKTGRAVLPPGRLAELGRVAHAVAEVANIAPDPHQPYVGASAFAHKAGLHVSAVKVAPDLYQHVDPASVGNELRLLVSELAGRATVELKGRALGLELGRDQAARVVERVKELESIGFSFEAAEASFELLLQEEATGERPRCFDLESWRVIVERRPDGALVSEATVKLRALGKRVVATGEGNGPVNALDRALRQALEGAYPALAGLELVDYKVRIVGGLHGSGAVTRVLVETSDGNREWSTVGVDENVIAASWQALEDAYTYGLCGSGDVASGDAAAEAGLAVSGTAAPR